MYQYALVSCGVHNVLTYHCCCPNIGSCVRVNKETGHCGTSGGHWMYWTTQSHSQLFCHTSKSCVVNFAFFAWNPFNLPRVVGWYHIGTPKIAQKGPFLGGTKGPFLGTLGWLKGFHAKNAKFTTHDLEVCGNS